MGARRIITCERNFVFPRHFPNTFSPVASYADAHWDRYASVCVGGYSPPPGCNSRPYVTCVFCKPSSPFSAVSIHPRMRVEEFFESTSRNFWGIHIKTKLSRGKALACEQALTHVLRHVATDESDMQQHSLLCRPFTSSSRNLFKFLSFSCRDEVCIGSEDSCFTLYSSRQRALSRTPRKRPEAMRGGCTSKLATACLE